MMVSVLVSTMTWPESTIGAWAMMQLVGHAARGYVSRIVADVGELGSCLRLVVTEDQSSAGGCLCDMGDELRVGVDDALRVAVGLCTAIAHDPGGAG